MLAVVGIASQTESTSGDKSVSNTVNTPASETDATTWIMIGAAVAAAG